MVVIMISGYMQSGKDTIGNYLCEKYNFTRLAFADSLKDEVADLYKLDRSLFNTIEGKNTLLKILDDGIVETMTVRRLLINHGSLRRSNNIDYWATIISNKIKELNLENKSKIVITDWRLPNEFDVINESLKGETIYKWRVNKWDKPPSDDYTEVALDKIDFDQNIDNKDIDFDTLYTKIDRILLEEKIV